MGGEKKASAKDEIEAVSGVLGQYMASGANLNAQYLHSHFEDMDIEFFHVFARFEPRKGKVAFYGEISAQDTERTQTNLFSVSFGDEAGTRRFLISPEDGFKGTNLASSLSFIDTRLLAQIGVGDLTGVRTGDSLAGKPAFHHISTINELPMVTGVTEENEGLILSVDGELNSCKTGELENFRSQPLTLEGRSISIKPRSIDIKICLLYTSPSPRDRG